MKTQSAKRSASVLQPEKGGKRVVKRKKGLICFTQPLLKSVKLLSMGVSSLAAATGDITAARVNHAAATGVNHVKTPAGIYYFFVRAAAFFAFASIFDGIVFFTHDNLLLQIPYRNPLCRTQHWGIYV